MKYYYECERGDLRTLEADNDEEAKHCFLMRTRGQNPLVLYRETGSDDGRPFVVIWESLGHSVGE